MDKFSGSDQQTQEQDQETKLKHTVSEFLQAPRKKRKNFIVVALGKSSSPELKSLIVNHCRKAYPKYAVATPDTQEDFLRQFTRNIMLAVVDDEFIGRANTLNLVKKMKERKRENGVPVVFLTKQPQDLIEGYQKVLKVWHEIDDYIQVDSSPRHALLQKIKQGVEEKNKRRSKRFKVSLPVKFSILGKDDSRLAGVLHDISIHGALLEGDSQRLFTSKDQMVIHIPISRVVTDFGSDVLRITAKVRRVFISGNIIGVSWEFVSDEKLVALTRLVIAAVDSTLSRQANLIRSKIIRSNEDQRAMMQFSLGSLESDADSESKR